MSLADAAASGLQRIILDERTLVESRRWSGESALGCGHPAPVHKHEFEIPGGCPERMQAWLAGVRLGATFVRSQAARPRRAPVRAPRFVPNPSFSAAYGRVGPIQGRISGHGRRPGARIAAPDPASSRFRGSDRHKRLQSDDLARTRPDGRLSHGRPAQPRNQGPPRNHGRPASREAALDSPG
jgi:hypothetical protein